MEKIASEENPKICRGYNGADDVSQVLSSLKDAVVLGINPPVYDFAWFDLWSKPVGLLSLLRFLRDRSNEVFFIDCLYEGRTKLMDFGRRRVERTLVGKPPAYKNIPRNYYRFGIESDDFRRRLSLSPRPDVVLVTSAMTYWYPGVFEAVHTAKEIFGDVPVLLGGTYARLCPEHAKRSGADFIEREAFLHSAAPAMDLYNAPEYGVLVTSRGCPMRCGYCASQKLWPQFVQRPLDEILADLHALAFIPTITDIAFYDDALLINKEKHFYPLCERLRTDFSKFRLHTPNGLHVAQLDDECCRMLYRTGFRTIRLSLEGTDRFTGAASSNKTDLSDYARAVSSLLAAGYAPDAIETYILVGLPGQNVEDIRSSIEYVKLLGGRPKLAEFSPIPGTPLYDASLARTPQIADEPLLHNNTVYAQYVAGSISPEDLQILKDTAKSR